MATVGRNMPLAPDGGWGWVVVGSLFVCSALTFGLLRSLGVFFLEFQQHFGQNAQAVSWITSISIAVQQIVSPVGTALCNAYGARPVVMTGGFLSALGLILASQATSLPHLYISMGLVVGCGWGLVFTPAVGSVMQYFCKRRSLATALGFSGIGLSSFAFSPLFQLLVHLYGWRGALLLLGGLSLNIVVCGALIRPLGHKEAPVQSQDTRDKSLSSVFSRLYAYLELSLLSQRAFLLYTLAVTLFNAGYFVPYVHLLAYSRHAGFSQYESALVLSAASGTDLLGRVSSGCLADMRQLRWRLPVLLSLWTGLMGVFLLLLAAEYWWKDSYPVLMLFALAYGFCAGAMSPLVFSTMPHIVGMRRMLGALGLLQLLESVGGLLGAPLSGWLRDRTGSYSASFLAAGGFLLMGTMVLMALPRYWSCSTPLESKPESGLLNPASSDMASESRPRVRDEGQPTTEAEFEDAATHSYAN